MKKILLTIISAAAILTGCNQEVILQDGTGSLSLDLDCKTDYTEVETKAATDEEIINALTIDIVRPADNWKVKYAPFSSIKGKVVELGSGSYILTASSPEKLDAAYDQPIFEGSKDFDIKVGEVTSVNLTCTISNLKVDIYLSENFVNELSDYTVTVTNGKGILTWTKNSVSNDFKESSYNGKTVYVAKKAGYFTVAPLTVTVDGHRKVDGTSASTTYTITNVAAANNHIISLDAQVIGTLNGVNISISHDVNPIDQPIVVPGFEETPVPGDEPTEGGDDNGDNGDDNTGDDNQGGTVTPPAESTAPSLVWAANPDFAPMTINASMNADMVVMAPKKIKDFKVIVNSPTINAQIEGLTADGTTTMDLINDEDLIEFLGDEEVAPTLPTADRLSGKTQVDFFLTGLVNMITILRPASGTQHQFTLSVVDMEGQAFSKTVTFVTE